MYFQAWHKRKEIQVYFEQQRYIIAMVGVWPYGADTSNNWSLLVSSFLFILLQACTNHCSQNILRGAGSKTNVLEELEYIECLLLFVSDARATGDREVLRLWAGNALSVAHC